MIHRQFMPGHFASVAIACAAFFCPEIVYGQSFYLAKGGYPLEFYDLDFSGLADPAKRGGPFDALHYIPVGPDPWSFLSLGGEVREQFWSWNYEEHGLRGPTQNTYDLSRLLIDAYFHVDRHLAFFVQLGRYDAFGKDTPLNAADASEGRVQQGFAELKERIVAADVTARLGRQEIALGSDRFVWVNDSSNIRTTHDGARIQINLETGASLDLAATRPTAPVEQPFADWASHSGTFLSAYASEPLFARQLNVDEYVFSVHSIAAQYDGLTGNEERETVGGRFWGSVWAFDYDGDFAYQFGTFSQLPISAFGSSARIAYHLPIEVWRPALQLQTSYFSGSAGPPGHPQTIGTFDPPFPRPTLLNYAGLETLENLIEAYPALVLNPSSKVTIRLGPEAMWRASIYDAVYVSRTVPLPATLHNDAQYIGTNLIAATTFAATENFRIFAEYVHELPGPAILLAGGQGSDAVVAQLDFNF
jgi:hypothetical protein